MIVEEGKAKRDENGDPLLLIRGSWEAYKEEICETLLTAEKKEVDIFIMVEKQKKDIRTMPQLAYLMGHLAPLAHKVLKTYGWETIRSKEAAIEVLKTELGFCDYIENVKTKGVRVINKSLSFEAREDRSEVAAFIERVFHWLIQNGAQPMTPDEYKRMKEIKKRKKHGG